MQRRTPAAAVAALLVLMSATGSHAQSAYPTQTIRFIVANPAGGLPDTIARIVARRMQERLGQSVIVENRPGANAGIGTAALTGAPADGYSFLFTDGAIVSISPLIFAKLPYNPNDLLPVALLARAPIFLAVHPKVPVTSFKALIDYAKANPDKLNYGSIGVGSFHHLSMEAINAEFGLRMTHVPFKGSGDSVGAFLGGHVDLLKASFAALRGAVETKKVTLLANNAAQRSPSAPDIPTVAEFIPGFDLSVMQGIFARTGTPPEIVQRIANEAMAIVKEAEVRQQFAVAGIEPVGSGPDGFRQALKIEGEHTARVVRIAGLKAQ